MSAVTFGYAQARMQARHGRRPPPQGWRQLEAIGDFAHYVQAVRGTGLRPWVAHVGPATDAHQIELTMRQSWREQVRAVAGWQPRPWRPAARWVAVLVDLPALQHLLRGEPAPPWMARDPLLAGAATDDMARRRLALRAIPELAPLLARRRPELDLAHAWMRHWRALWPAAPHRHRAALRMVQVQAGRLSTARDGHEPEPSVARLVEPVEHKAQRILHQHALTPAATFAYLLLVWTDYLRLRAGLMRRRLLPGRR